MSCWLVVFAVYYTWYFSVFVLKYDPQENKVKSAFTKGISNKSEHRFHKQRLDSHGFPLFQAMEAKEQDLKYYNHDQKYATEKIIGVHRRSTYL